jgi:hypothetical protein
MQEPSYTDFAKLYKVAAYLNGTKNDCLFIKPTDMNLVASADASFAIHTDGKSHTGGVIRIGERNAPVQAMSKRQKVVTRSTFESELVALNTVAEEAEWIRELMSEFGYTQDKPTIIEQDNKSCILVATQGPGVGKSRTMKVKYFWITEKIKEKVFELKYVESDKLIADGLTKPLIGLKFLEWKRRILNQD